MTSPDSQIFETFTPVYDTVPEDWEDAREFLVEQLKKFAIAINQRETGLFIDTEVLSGKQFIPTAQQVSKGSSDSQQFRTVLRIVVDVSPLAAGANAFAHGVTFDANLTSIDSWVEATNSTTLEAVTLAYPNLVINGPTINITSPGAYDRAFFFWEYTQEI